jgi:TRAP transporter TAXI family solute receptor
MSLRHNCARRRTWIHCWLLVGTILCQLTPRQLYAMDLFRIGTGGETGVYYPVGKALAEGITLCGQEEDSPLHGIIGVAQNSAGSLENARAVATKELEAGLVQADIAFYAHNMEKPFAQMKEATSIRAIASLYPEKFQIVVRNKANIRRIEELRGKRISLDEEGSGTLAVMRILLREYGLTEKELHALYLKPVFTENLITSGKLDGFVMMAGVPMVAVTKLAPVGVTLVPIDPEIAARINRQYPYLVPGSIKSGIYEGAGETPTLQVHALLVVHQDLREEIAYGLTKALFSEKTKAVLQKGHPQGKNITLDTALQGLSIPLHPGAKRYYLEQHIDMVQ